MSIRYKTRNSLEAVENDHPRGSPTRCLGIIVKHLVAPAHKCRKSLVGVQQPPEDVTGGPAPDHRPPGLGTTAVASSASRKAQIMPS